MSGSESCPVPTSPHPITCPNLKHWGRGMKGPESGSLGLTCLSGPQGWVSVLLLGKGRRNFKFQKKYPHSRVCLTSPDPDDPLSSYINANYIRGYGGEEKVYIATQGPIVSTVGDFWRMVWQEHTPIIVMITNIEEMNEKCTEYWPEEQVVYDGVEITVQKVIHTEDYRLRLIALRSGTEERGLKHYWFTSWPDQKTPDRAPPLLHLVQEVEEAAQQEGPRCAPIVVHCSAGIGRTGCFIATSICCQQLRHEGVVDILKTTCQLRQDRSLHDPVPTVRLPGRGGMIQTCEQYQFVHHVMSLYEKQLSHLSPE
ncbi:Tyrosine-protein phosphatase non-receptor type 5, partial [Eschrichtius robustus]|nr:Tyrosine-protein phosphatase non-receptor type 5 [Eschrichtius robustus]